MDKELIKQVAAKISAILLGVVFAFSGLVKAIDPLGGVHKFHDYFVAFGWDFLHRFELLFSFQLSAIEFTVGACLLLGAYRGYSSFFALLIMLFMTPLTLYLAIYNPVSDCGCFGDAIIITNWQTFYKNIVLLAAACTAFRYHKKLYTLYTFKAYWFVALFSYLFINGFAYSNYNKLPIVDFRPYKVGVNIQEAMSIPLGAQVAEERYSFVMEKDGIQKTFPLDNYPQNDTTWKFVEQKIEVITPGYVPPITDFSVIDSKEEDITAQLLEDTTGVFLLISPSLDEASDSQIERYNAVYDYAQANDYQFYCLTASSKESINRWIDNTGAEYPFAFTDKITLKTIIRSNPGLVLLKEGTILKKWSHQQLPDENLIEATMSHYLKQDEVKKEEDGRMMNNILTFTIPLLFIWIYDYLKNKRKRKKKDVSVVKDIQ
jgi:uncharacterized membrane protein YphA (DoxX/SURF4 family)